MNLLYDFGVDEPESQILAMTGESRLDTDDSASFNPDGGSFLTLYYLPSVAEPRAETCSPGVSGTFGAAGEQTLVAGVSKEGRA